MSAVQNGRFQNDSDSLRRFSAQFFEFQSELFNRTASFNQAYIKLGDTWKDDQYKRLGEKINRFCYTVLTFLKSTEPIPDDLNKLANKIDDYIGKK